MTPPRRPRPAPAAAPTTRRTTPALVATGLLLLTGLVAPVAHAQTGDTTWSVGPADNAHGTDRPHFAYDVDPGTSVEDAIVVTNLSATGQTFDVYASDAFTTPDGLLDLLPRDESSSDLGAWVEVSRDQVALAAGESVEIPFTVHVPADAAPGDHSAGIVTSTADDPGVATVTVDRRLGARMHVRVTGELVAHAEIRDVEVSYSGTANPLSPGAATVTYTLVNTGNTRLYGVETVVVTGPGGTNRRGVHTEDLGELVAGGEVTRTVPVTGVWPLGPLAAEVTVLPVAVGAESEALDTLRSDASAWAIPWTFLALVVVAVGLGVAGPRVLARRRAARAAASAPPAPSTSPDPTPTVDTDRHTHEKGTENT